MIDVKMATIYDLEHEIVNVISVKLFQQSTSNA